MKLKTWTSLFHSCFQVHFHLIFFLFLSFPLSTVYCLWFTAVLVLCFHMRTFFFYGFTRYIQCRNTLKVFWPIKNISAKMVSSLNRALWAIAPQMDGILSFLSVLSWLRSKYCKQSVPNNQCVARNVIRHRHLHQVSVKTETKHVITQIKLQLMISYHTYVT